MASSITGCGKGIPLSAINTFLLSYGRQSSMPSCLNCSSPLGSTTGLCYSCEQDSDSSLPPVDEDVLERVEQYCIIASLRCAECGSLHTTVNHDGMTYSGEDFDLEDEADWNRRMDKEAAWVESHQEAVQRALIEIEDEWPQTVTMIRRAHLS